MADNGPETMRRVGTALRASLQCWRCGEREAPLLNSGEVAGELGVAPLYCCADCARALDRLYRAVFAHTGTEASS